MATSIGLSEVVANILEESLKVTTSKADQNVKLLYGRLHEAEISIVAVVDCPSLSDQDLSCTVMETNQMLSGGAVLCGWAYLAKNKPAAISDLKQFDHILTHISDVDPVVLCYMTEGHGVQLISQSLLDVEGSSLRDVEVRTSPGALSDCMLARAKCCIPVAFSLEQGDSWKSFLQTEIDKLCTYIASEGTLFHLQDSKVLIGSNGCYGLPEDETFEYLMSCTLTEEDSGIRKKKQNKSLRCLNFEMYADLSGPCNLERTPSCAPIINYTTETVKKVNLRLPVDVVAILSPDTAVCDVAAALADCIVKQLQAMCRCIYHHSKDRKFVVPVPYHYQPLGLPTLVNVVLPRGITDEKLEAHRRQLHKRLCLPVDRPLFKRANQFVFPGQQADQGYLVNVHEGVVPSKVSGGREYLVQGSYTYHHYMQDRFDDNKWGCAYRSLQTLVSWFIRQGYTDRGVPTHREIQQTLVDIGDKEPSFVGSRRWIGSMEVSFVLDTQLGVTSKILSVSSGAEMSTKGRELAAHFSTQGTPVMIGGGVLAHTILGVDYDEVTGDIAFLILDPHYTDSEDLRVIQTKGWCGWKGPDFWDQKAHYNMCLPQRPNVI